MKKNIKLVLGIILSFMLIQFFYMTYGGFKEFSLYPFFIFSIVSMLYHHAAILFVIIVVNLIWLIAKRYNHDFTLYGCLFLLLFFIIYAFIAESLLFIIPAIVVPLFTYEK